MGRLLHKRRATLTASGGFTLIEVMLVLAITGMLLIGVTAGAFNSIKKQRYNDALRGFAEYMRTVYSEVISPQSYGLGNSGDQAILGKVLVFGSDNDDTIYSATIVGEANVPLYATTTEGFVDSLINSDNKVKLFCGKDGTSEHDSSTLGSYTPLWQAKFTQAKNPNVPATGPSQRFKGTMIISRTLTSTAIHTVFIYDTTYDLKTGCNKTTSGFASAEVNNSFVQTIADNKAEYNNSMDYENGVGICVNAEDAPPREVRIAANGRNTSAVKIMDERDSECQL